MSRRGLACLCLLLGAPGLTGCGSDEGDSGAALSAQTIQSYEGLYQLDGYTYNADGCDSPGGSRLETEPERLFVLVGASALGTRYLSLASCQDEAECAERVQAIRAPSGYAAGYSLILSEEHSADELGGLSAGSGYLENDVCTGREYTGHTLTRDGDAVRIESRLTLLDDAPPEDGLCWAKPAEQRSEAAGLPCAELQVLSGVKIGPLP